MNRKILYRTVFTLLASIFFLLSYAQNDSIDNVKKDKALAFQHHQGDSILSLSDAARIADSLVQVELKLQIDGLREQDNTKKAVLQARLDSLKMAQIEEDKRIKLQVDSLRTSTLGVPVVLYNDTLFFIYSKLGPYSPSDRKNVIIQKIEYLVDENLFKEDQLKIQHNEESDDIMHGDVIILSITDRDAFWVNKNRMQVATEYTQAIKDGINQHLEETSFFSNIIRIVKLLIVLLMFFFGVKFMNKGITWLTKRIIIKGEKFLNGIKFKEYEFLSAERELQIFEWLFVVVKWVMIVFIVYLALPAIFSIFPATKGIATTLIGYVLGPVKEFSMAIINYIPELITVIIIAAMTHYLVRFLKFLATEIEDGKLVIKDFFPEWARPTFTLIRVVIYAFSFIIIFPYLPGSESPVFKGVSVFLGLLISLGSSSAISNIIAGLVITYMRAFKNGDRVKIGETIGDVIDKTMLVTHVRTIKNEDVTIPNSAILNGSTINYTTSAKQLGLILNSTVTIGYDVPWKKVHAMLIDAANKTNFINKDPKPFVLQTSLDDFYVSYQINGYTAEAGKAAKIYSDLHANIQDAFNEAGIEILSPHYRAARDGNTMAIPIEYYPPNYKAPGFNINTDKPE